MKKQQYLIVFACEPEDLPKALKPYLAEGWRAQGGVLETEHGYYQAIVKDEPCQPS